MKSIIRKFALLAGLVSPISIFFSNIAQAKTLVYCSEGSPNGSFNPQFNMSLIDFDAVANTIYNRLVEFKEGTTDLSLG
ncbi:hypothetical protein [Candidatus Liberibacter americanus]|uniref:hypothetical protein n=1 Tax=Candidatus Liberibacter americanus TaxID=309868 RepID=UPI0002C60CA7|nr:dipeptide ABC transporter periplasmic substrate-binding protein DppA [Candidatus Liberibacter americanus PW_SP]